MFETFKKGQRAVLEVQKRALEKDVIVCIPTVEQRYDVVLVDKNGDCLKAQIKYADCSVTEGSVVLDLRKETRNNGLKKTYSEQEIDLLLVYLPKIDKVLAFGKDIFHQRQTLNIRFSPAKNGQKNGIFLYEDYIW